MITNDSLHNDLTIHATNMRLSTKGVDFFSLPPFYLVAGDGFEPSAFGL